MSSRNPKRQSHIVAATLLLWGTLHSAALLADIITDSQVRKTSDGVTISLTFSGELQFLSSNPEGPDTQFSLRLQPSQSSLSLVGETFWTQGELHSPESSAIVRSIQVEPLGDTQINLTVTLQSAMTLQVESHQGSNELRLRLRDANENQLESESNPTGRYAIQLRSSQEPLDLADLPQLLKLSEHAAYLATTEVDGKLIYQLKVGFFETRSEAKQVLATLKNDYPQAWVDLIPKNERARAQNELVKFNASTSQHAEATLTAAQSREILSDARAALLDGNNGRAIQLYTKVAEGGPLVERREALELLGVTREKQGQNAQAKAVYDRYLQQFPDAPGTKRVQQRLAGIVTATAKPKKRLRSRVAAASSGKDNVRIYGTASQYHRRYSTKLEGQKTVTPVNAVFSDLDVSVRKTGQRFDTTARATIGNVEDFENSDNSYTRLSSVYVDLRDIELDWSVRAGRQSYNSAGVLGRFDGIRARYEWSPWMELSAIGGYVVERSRDGFNSDRPFFGLSAEITPNDSDWTFSPFWIRQENSGILDRHAVGLEAQWAMPTGTLFSYVDYDIEFAEFNTAFLTGSWRYGNANNVHFNVSYRKSPFLTTRNAIIGQGVDSVEDLFDRFEEDEIFAIAEDRTGDTKTLSAGFNHRLNDTWQAGADFSMSEYSGTDASAGVLGLDPTGWNYFLNVQTQAYGLFQDKDIHTAQLRLSQSNSADSYSMFLTSKFPIADRWYLTPRMRFLFRDVTTRDRKQYLASPSLRAEFRQTQNLRFEIEAGYEFSRTDQPAFNMDMSTYYINLGYRGIFQ